MEPFYPLRAWSASECFLVQLEEYESPDAIFCDYAYFSSYSTSWLEHAERYAEAMVERFGLGAASHVVEVASNDGYLLQYFTERGIPVLGIEPAANVAEVAVAEGHPDAGRVLRRRDRARARGRGSSADLLIGNNVLAHVPDLNDFVARHEVAAQARRRDHDGVPAPDAADRREPVRHDLPRALLVPLVH